jgi:hypothetical protein
MKENSNVILSSDESRRLNIMSKINVLDYEITLYSLKDADYISLTDIARYKNHSSEFYRLLDQVMPDWYKQKDKLEQALI